MNNPDICGLYYDPETGEAKGDGAVNSPDASDSAFTDVALRQFADYYADHVFDAAYDALSGFCSEGEARKLAGEIVARLRGEMGVQDE